MIRAGSKVMHHRRSRCTVVAAAVTLAAVAVLAAACAFPIGRSVQGRDITLRTFGSGPKHVVLIGGLHTEHEDNSRAIAEMVAEYFGQHAGAVPSSVTLHIIPSANPDGTALGAHTNANGVDLNRNWPADDWSPDACHPRTGCRAGLGGPAPLSEPETFALYHFLAGVRPEITLVWHAHGPLVEANEVPGADAYANIYANAAGYGYIEEWSAYRITGQLIDALEQRHGLRAMDVELSQCCVVTPEEYDRNLAAVLALLQAVHTGLSSPSPTATPRGPRPTPTGWSGFPRKPTATRTPPRGGPQGSD
jgi:predicted deacylase